MSNFILRTKHPATGKYEDAERIDDYFGRHFYGVHFPSNGGVYRVSECEWGSDDKPPTGTEGNDVTST